MFNTFQTLWILTAFTPFAFENPALDVKIFAEEFLLLALL